MHKDDLMTPNERMAAIFDKKEFDRLPIMPFIVSGAGNFSGMTHKEKRSCAKNQAQAQIDAYKRLGHDALTIEFGLLGIGRACGTKLSDPENSAPAIVECCLKNLDQVKTALDLDLISREKDPWFRLCYEAFQICREAVGDEVPTSINLPGAITAAASIYPIEKLLKAIRRTPEQVHELLSFCTEAAKIVAKEFINIGCGVFIADPVASLDLINRETYREFVLPYTKDLVSYIHSLNAGVGYHICGQTNKIVADMLESGCNSMSLDIHVPVKDYRAICEDKAMIIGNVDVLKTLLHGTREDIHEDVKRTVMEGYGSKNGFVISTSCDIPISVTMENMDTFMEAGRKYGNYTYLQSLTDEIR